MQHLYEKGMTVKPTEHIAKSASTPKTGLFALLGGLRHVQGIGMPKTSRILGRRGLAVVALALCVLAFTAASAFASEHTYETSFGMNRYQGVAVNQETGNVYTVAPSHFSTGQGDIEVFGADGGSPSGETILGVNGILGDTTAVFASVAIDNACYFHAKEVGHALSVSECEAYDPSNGDLYLASEDNRQKFALNVLTHEYEVIQQFPAEGISEDGNGVAVDHQGNAYFVDIQSKAISEFDTKGEAVASIPIPGGTKYPAYVAVGAPGVIYVGVAENGGQGKGFEGEGVVKMIVSASGQVQSATELNEGGTAVAVDQRGNVYVDDGDLISEYSSVGNLVGMFGGSGKGAISQHDLDGLAVDDATGQVYTPVGDNEGAVIEVFAAVVVPGAEVVEEAVTGVEATTAVLQAQINPNGSNTTYRFEYDTSPYTSSAAHGTSLPVPNAGIGSGTSRVPVSVQLVGLRPGVSYYYRVVAESELKPGEFKTVDGPGKVLTTPVPTGSAPETCPNALLRLEQPFGLGLSDCRAYEMVSPLDKNDTDAVAAENDASRSSLSGDVFTYKSQGIFADPEAGWGSNQYLARRGIDGWFDQSIAPPILHIAYGSYGAYDGMAFTPELTEGVALTDSALTSEASPEYSNLYLADFGSMPVSYGLVAPTTERASGALKPEVEGESTDLSHVVYQLMPQELGAAESVDGKVFGLAGAGGGDGQPGENSAFFGDDSWRSVSADGSRVFFTTRSSWPAQYDTGRQLFVEANATSPTENCLVSGDKCIASLSASELKVHDPLGPGAARFRGASVNGSRVFFTDCSKLTKDATAVANSTATTCYPNGKTGNDLYEYDFEKPEGERLTDLTVDKADPLGAQVVGVPYISEDGSYVYFVAEGALTGKNAEGAEPISGESNLYVAHLEGGSWTTSFVATLDSSKGTNSEGLQEGGDSDVWNQMAPLDSARATPDGTHLTFVSRKSLTGYDNKQAETGECGKELEYEGSESGECTEVFSYDAVSQKLVCASCDPSGARPVGPSSLEEPRGGGDSSEAIGYTRHNFSENGARLFFDSDDVLVAHDSSGRQNVYEFEQPATQVEAEKVENSCTLSSSSFSKSSGGCIFAISDVAGNYESFFLDADPRGDNVFFATEDQLVPSDTDDHADVYDARVDGGFPVAAPSPECDNGDSCKPPASPQPTIFGAPSSATFSGPGNPVGGASSPPPPPPKKATNKTVRCKKGFAKNKKGKCVKKSKAKKKAKAKKTNRRASR